MSFALDLNKFAAKAGANADKVVRKVCLDLTKGIVEKTPVDTGRLRGNWQASVVVPTFGTVPTEQKDAGRVIAAAGAAIAKAPGNVWYLVNNLPYAAVAEYGLWGAGAGATQKTTRDGYSVQAPYGMVRVTYANVRASLA